MIEIVKDKNVLFRRSLRGLRLVSPYQLNNRGGLTVILISELTVNFVNPDECFYLQ